MRPNNIINITGKEREEYEQALALKAQNVPWEERVESKFKDIIEIRRILGKPVPDYQTWTAAEKAAWMNTQWESDIPGEE